MKNVEISIIVPVYNVEKYLEKCIDSVLIQTFTDFELILVDDGSKDKSGELCDYISKKDDRVKVIHKQNGGLSSARNAGLKIAKGRYIGFVDSDDIIHKDMFNTLYENIIENKAQIVQCGFYRFVNENELKSLNKKSNEKIVLEGNDVLNGFYSEDHVETVVAWNKLYDRKLFDDIQFPINKLHEDEFTTYKLFYKSKKVVLIHDYLYFYRNTPNSIMNSKFSVRRLDILEALNQRIIFAKSNMNNTVFYKKTINFFYLMIIEVYYECYLSERNNKQTLEKILYYFRSVSINELLKNCNMKTIIKVLLFTIIPKGVYYKMLKK